MASPGNRHCANCIGALSFPIYRTEPATERWKAQNLKVKKTDMLRSIGKQSGERRGVGPGEENKVGRICRKGGI